MKRRKMSNRSSRQDFKRKTGTLAINKMQSKSMRGGIRL